MTNIKSTLIPLDERTDPITNWKISSSFDLENNIFTISYRKNTIKTDPIVIEAATADSTVVIKVGFENTEKRIKFETQLSLIKPTGTQNFIYKNLLKENCIKGFDIFSNEIEISLDPDTFIVTIKQDGKEIGKIAVQFGLYVDTKNGSVTCWITFQDVEEGVMSKFYYRKIRTLKPQKILIIPGWRDALKIAEKIS